MSEKEMVLEQSRQTNDEFVALSQFTVAEGMEDSVKDAFMNRPHLVDNAPGFIRMDVLRPTTCPQEFWLMTWWKDECSYETWHQSHAYHESHKQMPKGLKLVPGSAKITKLGLLSR